MTDFASETSPADPVGCVVAPPTNRMVIAILALIGLCVALYLWAHNAGLTGSIVCGVGDCATVQSSPFGYIVVLALSFVGLQPAHRDSALIGGLLLAGSGGGVVFSGWLTYLEAFVINAWCQYCVISAILITLIFLASLPEIPRLRGGTS
jgi:uncharacterized membrane protein